MVTNGIPGIRPFINLCPLHNLMKKPEKGYEMEVFHVHFDKNLQVFMKLLRAGHNFFLTFKIKELEMILA